MLHMDLPRSWHRGFPDERDAEEAGGWREGFGRCESLRAFVHRARPDATLGFEGSRGNSHRARLDATGISSARGIGASPMSGRLRMAGVGGRASGDARACGRSFIGQGPMPHLDSRVRGRVSSSKARCYRDLPRSWHRGFPDERDAEDAGVGGRASGDARACGRSFIGQGPMLHLDSKDCWGISSSKARCHAFVRGLAGDSHRARPDATL